jgi:hypothetical protein
MNGSESGAIAAGMGAVLFGVVYALLVYIPLHGKHAGYTSLLVVGGVLGTLAFVGAVYGVDVALGVGLLFCCTGGPMIVGEAVKTKWLELQAGRDMAARIEKVINDQAPGNS